jgi:hypothetical protein
MSVRNRRGLRSSLFISCKCECSTAVKTGKQHADSSEKKLLPIYGVNTKLACLSVGLFLNINWQFNKDLCTYEVVQDHITQNSRF